MPGEHGFAFSGERVGPCRAPLHGDSSSSTLGLDSGAPGFVGLRLWVEQEVDAHVKRAVNDLAPLLLESGGGDGGQRCVQLEAALTTVAGEQRLLSDEFRRFRAELEVSLRAGLGHLTAASTPTSRPVSPERGDASFSSRAEPRHRRDPSSRETSKLPGLAHSLHLSIADLEKRARAVDADVASVHETVADLRREVRAAASAAVGAQRHASRLEARLGLGGDAEFPEAPAPRIMAASSSAREIRADVAAMRSEIHAEASMRTITQSASKSRLDTCRRLRGLLGEPTTPREARDVGETRSLRPRSPKALKPSASAPASEGPKGFGSSFAPEEAWEAVLQAGVDEHHRRKHEPGTAPAQSPRPAKAIPSKAAETDGTQGKPKKPLTAAASPASGRSARRRHMHVFSSDSDSGSRGAQATQRRLEPSSPQALTSQHAAGSRPGGGVRGKTAGTSRWAASRIAFSSESESELP